MVSKASILVAGSFSVWVLALAVSSAAAHGSTVQKTTNDGLYSKAQADAAKARFEKICADCHAFSAAASRRPTDPPLGDEPFLRKWDGRALDDLVNLIVMTMPNDGSAVVSDAEAVNLVAYILQQNGYPAGAKPLTKDATAAVVARPKKAGAK